MSVGRSIGGSVGPSRFTFFRKVAYRVACARLMAIDLVFPSYPFLPSSALHPPPCFRLIYPPTPSPIATSTDTIFRFPLSKVDPVFCNPSSYPLPPFFPQPSYLTVPLDEPRFFEPSEEVRAPKANREIEFA